MAASACIPAHVRGTGCIARPPRAVSATTSNNCFRASRAHGTAASASSHEHSEDDLLVKDAADLVAAAHVADRHEVGIDHSGQLSAWARLPDHAELISPSNISPSGAARWPLGRHHRSTQMMTVSDSVVGFWSNLFEGRARDGARAHHAVGIGRSADGRRKVVLRHVYATFDPAPYYSEQPTDLP